MQYIRMIHILLSAITAISCMFNWQIINTILSRFWGIWVWFIKNRAAIMLKFLTPIFYSRHRSMSPLTSFNRTWFRSAVSLSKARIYWRIDVAFFYSIIGGLPSPHTVKTKLRFLRVWNFDSNRSSTRMYYTIVNFICDNGAIVCWI